MGGANPHGSTTLNTLPTAITRRVALGIGLLLLWAALPAMAWAQDAPGMAEPPPTAVRVAILNASGNPLRGTELALVLEKYRRRELESLIGLRLELVNVASADTIARGRSELRYRPGFLQAALVIARTMPGDQVVRSMGGDALKKLGIDVEILLGADKP